MCADLALGHAFTQVGTRIMKKRIHVRVEHAVPSRCREEFLARRSSNDALKAAAKKEGSECRAGQGGGK